MVNFELKGPLKKDIGIYFFLQSQVFHILFEKKRKKKKKKET